MLEEAQERSTALENLRGNTQVSEFAEKSVVSCRQQRETQYAMSQTPMNKSGLERPGSKPSKASDIHGLVIHGALLPVDTVGHPIFFHIVPTVKLLIGPPEIEAVKPVRPECAFLSQHCPPWL